MFRPALNVLGGDPERFGFKIPQVVEPQLASTTQVKTLEDAEQMNQQPTGIQNILTKKVISDKSVKMSRDKFMNMKEGME